MSAKEWCMRLWVVATIVVTISSESPPLSHCRDKTDGVNDEHCASAPGTCALALKCSGGMTLEVPIQGIAGPRGPPGEPGPAGRPGRAGPKGITGDEGEVGLRGQQGYEGQPGEDGSDGREGDKGSDGLPGFNGSKGLPGDVGDIGFQGRAGLVGFVGSKGEKGDLGARGPKGLPGDAGDHGIYGETGPKGLPGVDGLRGFLGGEDCRVAFYAALTNTTNLILSEDNALTFDTVFTNEGRAFLDSGRFVAPYDGTYAFYITASSSQAPGGGLDLQHNGKSIGSTIAYCKIRQVSAANTFIIDLKKYDTVQVVVDKLFGKLAPNMANTFAGLCLWKA